MRAPIWLALALGGMGCSSENGLNKVNEPNDVEGGIEVDPTYINFGVLEAGEEASAVVTITNVGTGTLHIEGLVPAGSSAFTITSDRMLEELPPDEYTEFKVTYVATGEVDEGTVTVLSTDTVSPEVPVELLGGLTDPLLVWDPDPVDFGALGVGESATIDVTMTNEGATDLEISELTLEGDDEFTAEFPELPLTLSEGESATFPVTFESLASTDYSATIVAVTNADSDNDVDLVASGSSGPIAVCSVSPEAVTSHSETATWTGDESYDPGGRSIVNYEWTLISQPAGSSATMPSGGAIRRPFVWDLAGEYVGQLIVTNDLGEASEPCEATLTATPGDDFWIEMYWQHSGDDMDLHLLAPGGSLETNSDCYFSNCVGSGLDWGSRGVTEDNPSLDLDDISGTGPENTRIEEPEDGTFTVIVHDYPGSTYTSSNRVWVNIYIGGELAWSDTRDISGENSYEEFATVSFPSGTVTDR